MELQEIQESDFDLSLTGFDPGEIDGLLALEDEEQANAAPPLPEAAVSRPSDLWLLGSHRVLCGDATSAEAVARLLGERKPRLMVTDPPYGIELDSDPGVFRCPQMTGHGAKFGRKKEDAIVALLTHRTIEEAARSINVSTKTLLRWMKEPEFDAAYRAAKRAAFAQSIARLQHLTSAAVSTLGKVMLDPATPATTKVRAADSILARTAKAIEIEDIEARVSELERAASEGSRR